MSDPTFEDLSDAERDELYKKVFEESDWLGKSCMSRLWPYTADETLFEARRAVANLTEVRYAYDDPGEFDVSLTGGTPELSDLLAFVKAADSIARAANSTLEEVVAETRARGATWGQIAEVLGGKDRRSAQKRFGAGLSSKRKRELQIERVMSDVVVSFWKGLISDEVFGFDSEYWEAVPGEVAVSHAIRSFMRATVLLASCFNPSFPDEATGTDDVDPARFDSKLLDTYAVVRNSFHILATPRAIDTIMTYSKEMPEQAPWADENVNTYFTQAILCVALVFDHFNRAWEARKAGDARVFMWEIYYVHDRMNSAVYNFAKPGCVYVRAILERVVVESGHSLLRHKYATTENVDQAEAFKAYWKRDSEKLAKLMGIAYVEDRKSLDELLETLDEPTT